MHLFDKILNPLIPFGIGGVSGAIATSVIQPLDTLKVQIQIVSEQIGRSKTQALGIRPIFLKIMSEKGFQVLYRGLDSAIFRQLFYASARIGAYESSLNEFQKKVNRKTSKGQKIMLSLFSGGVGALLGNPFDVALIRRQASIANNKNAYPNTAAAFKNIIKNEGFFSLWRGLDITIWRVCIINLGQLAGKDIISDYLSFYKMDKDTHNNFTALTASLLTAFISLPVDNLKVKLQKQDKTDIQYNGIADCLIKSIRKEGLLRLWVGLPIYFIRGTPHSFILLKTQIFLTEEWKKVSKLH